MLVDAQRKLGIELGDPANRLAGDQVLKPNASPVFRRKLYKLSHQLDSAEFFFDNSFLYLNPLILMNLEKLFLFLPVSICSKFGIFGAKNL